jgi:DNA-directed RNA polymerase subunit RPC12/RpoP
MPIWLPLAPVLRCERCGEDRFVPLTYPGRRHDLPARPDAKCVGCGHYAFVKRRSATEDGET